MCPIRSIKKIFFSLSEATGGGAVEGRIKGIHRASTTFHSAQRGINIIFVNFSVLIFLITACAPTGTPIPETRIVNVYATLATQPWLADVFACASRGTVIRVADTPADADISLRLGEPELLVKPAYQINTEEIVVVMNYARPLSELSLEQVRELFTGSVPNWNGINPEWGEAHASKSGEVHVWVYSSGEDIQQVFDRLVLEGRLVTSQARLAVSPQQMHDEVANDESAIGFVPRRWFTTSVFEEAVIPDIPVLAIANEEPQGAIQLIIACLQK